MKQNRAYLKYGLDERVTEEQYAVRRLCPGTVNEQDDLVGLMWA